ncbi:hypothetical protein IGS68_35140 (plasmid) [Skermanella sp. TT6]|uniref:Peptidase S24/S26A/S26B/S26C domain-containing protein n=1 Tax=Skermanella cutis TaxID=2775420 RepID=A0ABX7BIN9_9PROT|nr:hypothetical protein [Skermanella sp. TT6]QQP94048.1 hypothetical protein IGS68_35140 [Skermanella sp. TT6]
MTPTVAMLHPARTWADSFVLYTVKGKKYNQMTVDTADKEEVVGKRYLYESHGYPFEAKCSEYNIGHWKVIGRVVNLSFRSKKAFDSFKF